MTLYGRIDSVYSAYPGTTVDVAFTGNGVLTVVTVESTGEFNENGGSFVHQESGVTYAYSSLDEDASTLTLATPPATGVNFAVGDTLNTFPMGAELYADVFLDDVTSEDAIPMRVQQGVRGQLGEGTRDGTYDGEVAEVEEKRPGQYVVVDIVADDLQTQIDTSTLGITQADISTDGNPPGAVLGLTAIGGKKFIMLRWNPVLVNNVGGAQNDLMHYNIHVSTSSTFVPGPTNKLGQTYGTMFMATTLADGTAMVYDNPTDGTPQSYYFAVIAEDADGVGVAGTDDGRMERTGTDDIIVGAVTAGLLESILVLGTTVTTRSQDVNGDLVGPGYTMTPTTFTAYNAAGDATLEITPNSSPSAVFRGDAEIDHLTVQTLTTLQETLLAQGSVLKMQTGVAPPSNPPTLSYDWVTNQLKLPSGAWGDRHSFAPNDTGNNWITFNEASHVIEEYYPGTNTRSGWSTVFNSSAVNVGVCYVPATPAASTFTADYVWMVRQVGSAWQLLRIDPFYDYQINGSTIDITSDVNPAGRMAIGPDRTTGQIMVAYIDATSSKLVVKRYTATSSSAATLNSTFTSTTVFSSLTSLAFIEFGPADFGSGNWYITKNVGAASSTTYTNFIVVSSAGARDTTKEWDMSDTGDGYLVGCYWDGTNFKSMTGSGAVRKYEVNNKWTAAGDQYWYSSYTWRNGTAETLLGPWTTITMKKRARLTVKTSTPPAGVTDSRVYLARGSSYGRGVGTSSMTLQGAATGSPTPSLLITNAVFTPLNDPTASGFGVGTPAAIQSDGATPNINIVADGSFKLGPFQGTSSGVARHTITMRATNTAQTLTSSTWTTVTLGATPGNQQDITTSGSSAIIAESGLYACSAQVQFDSGSAAGRRVAKIESYTTEAVSSGFSVARAEVGSPNTTTLSCLDLYGEEYLAAGTKVRLIAQQTSGASLDINNGATSDVAKLNIRRIG